VRVKLSGDRLVEVERIIALTGFRPDLSLTTELALDLAPVTEGAGGIARKLAYVTDCLAVPTLTADDLASGDGVHKTQDRVAFLYPRGCGVKYASPAVRLADEDRCEA
jgi:hypothetical protein